MHPDADLLSCRSFEEVFSAVDAGRSGELYLLQLRSSGGAVCGTYWQRHRLDAEIVRIVGGVKAELGTHGKHGLSLRQR